MADYKTLSLREAAEFDRVNNLKAVHTGWRKVSDLRREKGISRKQTIQSLARKDKS